MSGSASSQRRASFGRPRPSPPAPPRLCMRAGWGREELGGRLAPPRVGGEGGPGPQGLRLRARVFGLKSHRGGCARRHCTRPRATLGVPGEKHRVGEGRGAGAQRKGAAPVCCAARGAAGEGAKGRGDGAGCGVCVLRKEQGTRTRAGAHPPPPLPGRAPRRRHVHGPGPTPPPERPAPRPPSPERARAASIRLEASGDHPPNLSISLSGGKEINRDLPSSGERTGASPALNRGPAHAGREMWGEGLPAHPRGRGRAPHVRGKCKTAQNAAPERVTVPWRLPVQKGAQLSRGTHSPGVALLGSAA